MYRLHSKILIIGFIATINILFSSQLYSQLNELTVQKVDPDRAIPVFRSYPDHAAVIINSSLTNLIFDSNVEIVADLSDPASGEYRLILPPFRQTISVQLQGYKQLRFTVPLTSKRQVLFYEINPIIESEDIIPVLFDVSPIDAGATLFLNGQEIDFNLLQKLPPGTHEILVQAEGFKTISEKINVDQENIKFSYALEELKLVPISIISNSEDAIIQLNNEEVSRVGKWEGFKFPGDYYLTIVKNGFSSVQENIIITEIESENKFNYELKDLRGTLSLSTNPPDAIVSVNGDLKSNRDIKVVPGNYQIKIEKSGYYTKSEFLTVEENQIINKEYTLVEMKGVLQFTIQPVNAAVSLFKEGGMRIDTWSGIKQLSLPIGSYYITYESEDYVRGSQIFTVSESENKVLDVVMIALSEQEKIDREKAEAERLRKQKEAEAERLRKQEQTKINRELAKKRKTKEFFTHPEASGLYAGYSIYSLASSAYQSNVETNQGYNLGYISHKNRITRTFDFTYNNFNISDEAAAINSIDNSGTSLDSWEISFAVSPTLVLGPIWFGVGPGINYHQFRAADIGGYEYFYDNYFNTYYSISAAYMNRGNWGLMIDYKKSFDSGILSGYRDWNKLRFMIMLYF